MADAAEELTVEILRRLSALERRVAAVVRVGCVAAVQADPYRVQVNLGSSSAPVLTGMLPVVVPRAGGSVQHSPLSVGEAVLVVAAGGSDTALFAVGSLPTSRNKPAADQADDGVTYLVGDMEIDGDLAIDGNLTVTGNISADGEVSAGSDVSAGGDVVAGTGTRVRLLTHVHNPPLGGPPQRV